MSDIIFVPKNESMNLYYKRPDGRIFKASEWISVKDRLPNNNFQYEWLLITDGKEVNIASWQDGWFVGCPIDYVNEFTHWMPLPEPPKDE